MNRQKIANECVGGFVTHAAAKSIPPISLAGSQQFWRNRRLTQIDIQHAFGDVR
jgi:hypothetical protein